MAEDAEAKRGYDLRKRLENTDQTRRAVLLAARRQLEAQGYREMTMASLAKESGVTRQTIHNLFGSKRGVLETLFDSLALESGMDRMRELMTQKSNDAILQEFVQIFCSFWKQNHVLIRRIHGIGAVDPDFGEIVQARNQRRNDAANRIVKRLKGGRGASDAGVALSALTSFEFYDTLTLAGKSNAEVGAIILNLASASLNLYPA